MQKVISDDRIYYVEDFIDLASAPEYKWLELSSIVLERETVIKCRYPMEYVFDTFME